MSIICGVDFSAHAVEAVAVASALAARLGRDPLARLRTGTCSGG